jgi:gliding motility-associated-like protein
LHVTDANGCTANGTPIVVGQDAGPIADFSISSTIVSPGEIVTFIDASTGGPIQSYSWVVDTTHVGTGTSATYSSEVEGSYTVTLTIVSQQGCIDSVTKTFQIFGELHIPNIITVNGDGVNDEFYIRNLKPNSQLLIVNRWGNPVLETEDYQNNWNGRDKVGTLLEEGVYFYRLITPDGKIAQGNVQLLIK